MRVFRTRVAALAALHELAPDRRRLSFRRAMASLAQVAIDPAAVPFEGVDPELLLDSVRVALSDGLFDDLTFLPDSGAACSLYALASALPSLAAERRELGRRVLLQVQQGSAESFVALATAFALGGARAFEGPLLRARLELVLMLPIRAPLAVDSLAFALVSRRELAQRWLVEPASGALPARRMAARLLERAARHAALRAQEGDDGELAIFEAPHIQGAFAQLLSDREPLVARHVLSARGLLSVHLPRFGEELERDLVATQSIARVRRGAISLAARAAVRPMETLMRARMLSTVASVANDATVASALLSGLAPVAEVEPEAAEHLSLLAVERGGLIAAEAMVELRRELLDRAAFAAAAQRCRGALADALAQNTQEAGQRELLALLYDELAEEREPSGLPELVSAALHAHAHAGPLAALPRAREALAYARNSVNRLCELLRGERQGEERELFRLLHDLDVGLLASPTLFALFASAPLSEARLLEVELTHVLADLLRGLRTVEARPQGEQSVDLTLRMRRLRTLLHLLDGEFHAGGAESSTVRREQLATIAGLYARVAEDGPSATDRIVHAALARALDAVVRDEQLEISDAVLCSASAVKTPEGLTALAEGCIALDLRAPLRALAELTAALTAPADAIVGALGALAHALPSDGSARTEALRRALLALTRACEAMLGSASVRELVRARRALTLFEGAVVELVYLMRGAERRVGMIQEAHALDQGCVAALARALESQVAQGEADLAPTLKWLSRELGGALPLPVARATVAVLETLRERPLDSVTDTGREPHASASTTACPLPAWLPASRRFGPYFVVRPLGTGLASSAFLVKHQRDRFVAETPQLVLKVPRYDANTARELSAQEFEQRFAAALPALARLPAHPNLAAVLGVDVAHAPKPYLLMKLVDGPTLLRVRKRRLEPMQVLDGILSGLSAMHASGVGHLDLSPRNVMLCFDASGVRPVLVDYGLSGPEPLPGCFDPAYAPPERWTLTKTTTRAVDVYAVGCLAYELVTGRPLFAAEGEEELASQHRAHDGAPPPVLELADDPRHRRLAEWMTLCLRNDPSERATCPELREALREVDPLLDDQLQPQPPPFASPPPLEPSR